MPAAAAALAALSCAGPIHAQTETLPYDHMHLAAANRTQAMDWYLAHMGAARHELGDRVAFGRITFSWFERATSPSSDGSVIDHIAFSVADLDAALSRLQAAGVRVISPARDVAGLFRAAFIEDPWGVKIELVQVADTPGFHHIHMRLPDPERSLTWYQARFGGERAKLRGRLDGLKYDRLWLLVEQAEGAPRSEGRAIDHLGWRVRDIEATIAASRVRGDRITMEPRNIRDVRVGVIEDPDGVRIELAQRPQF
jgi:catechol 2,3-dioxygenase-like lactoylglutathione lyase family enzyme